MMMHLQFCSSNADLFVNKMIGTEVPCNFSYQSVSILNFQKFQLSVLCCQYLIHYIGKYHDTFFNKNKYYAI